MQFTKAFTAWNAKSHQQRLRRCSPLLGTHHALLSLIQSLFVYLLIATAIARLPCVLGVCTLQEQPN